MTRVMFMGTPDFAVPTLEALIGKYNVVCVVSQPDRPKGRGHKMQPTATKETALIHGIPVEQPLSFKDGAFQSVLEKYYPDVIVVAAFGRILPEYVLRYPKYGCINVHGSILPKYRGAAPIQWAILNGEKETGITIMHMARELDAGDIIHIKRTDILPQETSGELFGRLSRLGAEALMEIMDAILDGTAPRKPQDDTLATFAPMIDKNMALLDFSMSADRFERYVRGFSPWPTAKIMFRGQPVKVMKATPGSCADGTPGTVLEIGRDGITVCCGDGNSVCLKQLQKAGKNTVDAYSFAQGEHIKTGDNISEER